MNYNSQEAIYSGDLIRKDVKKYSKDIFVKRMLDRNKSNGFRRFLWNVMTWYVEHRYNSVLADMLFTAYRVGYHDGHIMS